MVSPDLISKYPLTSKWLPYVHRFSFREKIPFQHCFQESLILEWQMQSKFYKTRTPQGTKRRTHVSLCAPTVQDQYFKWSLSHRLKTMLLKDFQRKERFTQHSDRDLTFVPKWRHRTVAPTDLLASNDDRLEGNHASTFDKFVECRPFSEMYYEELVSHVATILLAMDRISSEMFLHRVYLQQDWKVIKSRFYLTVPHNKFYNKIKLIRSTVKKEICYDGQCQGFFK